MGRTEHMDIQLDSPVYYAGDTVKGEFIMKLKEPMKMRSLCIWLTGKCKVHFTRTKYGRGTKNSTHYRSEEKYVESSLVLFGSDAEAKYHPEGSHRYPFEFPLPVHVASSFKGPHGFVRYLIKVVIDRPWKFNQERTKAFTVLNPLDLNIEQTDMSLPLEEERGVGLKGGCCGMGGGAISARLHTGRAGYVPGETIDVSAELYNQSSVPVTKVKIVLKRYVEFIGKAEYLLDEPKPSREWDSKVIARAERGGLSPNSQDFWQGVCLEIPPTPPSRLDNCNAINIMYYVEKGEKISLSTEVIIGTMPLRGHYQQLQPQNYENIDGEPDSVSHPVINIKPAGGDRHGPQPPPYTDLPPSYEHSKVVETAPPAYEQYDDENHYTYDDDEEADVYGEENEERQPIEWAPIYPTFRGFKGILGAVRAKNAFGQNLQRSRAAAAAAAANQQREQENQNGHVTTAGHS